jgi:hypothetical protein
MNMEVVVSMGQANLDTVEVWGSQSPRAYYIFHRDRENPQNSPARDQPVIPRTQFTGPGFSMDSITSTVTA